MKMFDRVKFQRPETGEICEGLLGWDAGEVQFLNTWSEVEGMQVGPITTEVARQGDDGIFRRVTDFKLDKMGENVLRSLRDIAATANEI